MPLITTDDFSETLSRLQQRGAAYLWSKLQWSALARTRSTFNEAELELANWWIIPAVRRRWNEMISGQAELEYEDYVVEKYLSEKKDLRLLSLGCGIGSHERRFATHREVFAEVRGLDISDRLIQAANAEADELGLDNARFEVADVNALQLQESYWDVVLFHQALHHFKNVEHLLREVIRPALKPGGLLILHEYVGPNRLQWCREQLREVNRLLREEVPPSYRRRFKSKRLKKNVSGPGRLRMLLSDPSEAVDAEAILPALHQLFDVLEEKPIGGNLLMLLFKDIAHHFRQEDEETRAILQRLFQAEDLFLQKHPPLLQFGVYRKGK